MHQLSSEQYDELKRIATEEIEQAKELKETLPALLHSPAWKIIKETYEKHRTSLERETLYGEKLLELDEIRYNQGYLQGLLMAANLPALLLDAANQTLQRHGNKEEE